MILTIITSVIVALVGCGLITMVLLVEPPKLINSLIVFDQHGTLLVFSFAIFLLTIVLPGMLLSIACEFSYDETPWRISHGVVGSILLVGYIIFNYFLSSKEINQDIQFLIYKVPFLWGGPVVFLLSFFGFVFLGYKEEREFLIGTLSIGLHLILFFVTAIIALIIYDIDRLIFIIIFILILLVISSFLSTEVIIVIRKRR